MIQNKRRIAESLLQIKAVKLEPANPFTWASGWKSPIYCDNRKTLSYPEIRTFIRNCFAETIQKEFPGTDLIAGVATGGIAQGALVADQLDLPFAYVRSSTKTHGLDNLIEGVVNPGQKVVVVEDLVSTGGSSLKAVHALRAAGCVVSGLIAIFTYGFQAADEAFRREEVKLIALSDYDTLLDASLRSGAITPAQLDVLRAWRENPSEWNPKNETT
jgi:orotate phosphoribosyltransferase